MRKLSILIVIVVIAIIGFIFGCSEVGPQEGGVRTNMLGFGQGFGKSGWFKQGIVPVPLEPGLYINIPHLTIVDIYPVQEMHYDMFQDQDGGRDDVSFKTKDGQKAWIDVTVRYRLDFEKLPELHRRYGKTFITNIVRPTVRSLINNKLGEYSAEEIYDGRTRQKVAKEIRELVNSGTETQTGTTEFGLIITEILFRRFEFTEEYQAAIEMKRIAVEQRLAAEELAKKTEAEAEGERLAMVKKAQGEAKKIELSADANLYAKQREALGIEEVGLAQAKAQKALVEALSGNGAEQLVRMEFAKHLGESFQVWGIPTGDTSTSVMDLSGVLGSMFPKSKPSASQ
ncbi:hypothetical protein JW979_14920 [bacterium]|nr:hypothetical protein [candidate division CSSED10-310 bacterium]